MLGVLRDAGGGSEMPGGAVTKMFFWQEMDLSRSLLQTSQHSLLNASCAKEVFRTVPCKQQRQRSYWNNNCKVEAEVSNQREDREEIS